MARILRPQKPLIYVFCEGESEQAYMRFLKEQFSDVASIQAPVKGLFNEAKDKFQRERVRFAAKQTDDLRATTFGVPNDTPALIVLRALRGVPVGTGGEKNPVEKWPASVCFN